MFASYIVIHNACGMWIHVSAKTWSWTVLVSSLPIAEQVRRLSFARDVGTTRLAVGGVINRFVENHDDDSKQTVHIRKKDYNAMLTLCTCGRYVKELWQNAVVDPEKVKKWNFVSSADTRAVALARVVKTH